MNWRLGGDERGARMTVVIADGMIRQVLGAGMLGMRGNGRGGFDLILATKVVVTISHPVNAR